MKNYRPVSNLTLISKVVQRVIAEQVVRYLQAHDLLPRLQSAYRRHHLTETALLRVLSDIYAGFDRLEVTLLGLLDLSAAFDCFDHDILLRRLEQSFGIRGTVLTWIKSFLHVVLSKCATPVDYQLLFSWSLVYRRALCSSRCSCCIYTAELFEVIASSETVM